MPYITQEARKRLLESNFNNKGGPETAGELNYLITTSCLEYINKKGMSYDTLNSVCGVLTCSQMELYRRHIAPYEDTKILQNGDV